MTTDVTTVTDLVKWAYRQPKNVITRRIEIYESDGETLWLPSIDTERLIGGSINISYDRDERRQLNNLQIANYDDILRYDPNGFWYDKIIRIYRGIKFTNGGEDYKFEMPIGEFMIDRIVAPAFPNVITITGRDYSKKLINDKFADPTTFTSGSKLDDVVKAIALNGGIKRFRLNATGITLGADLTIDRFESRWSAIKRAVQPNAVSAYFANDGYLVTERIDDVSTTPPAFIFGDSEDTDGATRAERSITDVGIYNDLVVRSSNSDAETAGVAPMSRWQNTDPESPTSVAKLGRRSSSYESELFLTKADTDAYLASWKQTAALETWEMTFGLRYLPWLEAGRVIELPDEDNPNVPARYFLTDLDAPLGLGAVSGTAKRLTIIG